MAKETEEYLGIPTKLAYLHQALTWPGVAGAETTIGDFKIKGIKIFYNVKEQCLILKVKDKTCRVPLTNVVCAIDA